MAETGLPQAAIDAAAEAIRTAQNANDDEPERWEANRLAQAALAAAAPHLAQHGDPLPARDAHHFMRITCASCSEEFGTNCEDEDITCPNCEARRCPCCGCWYGEAEAW